MDIGNNLLSHNLVDPSGLKMVDARNLRRIEVTGRHRLQMPLPSLRYSGPPLDLVPAEVLQCCWTNISGQVS